MAISNGGSGPLRVSSPGTTVSRSSATKALVPRSLPSPPATTHRRARPGGEPLASLRLVGLDRSTAALVVKVGSYPVDHGALAVVRTLGRAGVPVGAFVSDPRA